MTVMLRDIIALLAPSFVQGDLRTRIVGVTHDSRKVKPGYMFVAIQGESVDGHDFIDRALEAGASAVLAVAVPTGAHENVPWITVPDTRLALGSVSSLVYAAPSRDMTLVGITGTNGKTTLTFLLEAISSAAGEKPGVVGTITHRWGGKERFASNTTPEASDIQEMLALMRADGITHVFMEVSSHGLHLGRLSGCEFDAGAFTTLTQDHLDYHGTMDEYYRAKRILFTRLLPSSSKGLALAVVNGDDPYGRRLMSELEHVPTITYGTSPDLDVYPVAAAVKAEGIDLEVRTKKSRMSVSSRLTGQFNVSNILGAIAVAEGIGIADDAITRGIRKVEDVPGRLERVPSDLATVFVDYAHTPSALKNVLKALTTISSGRIVTIMGCGGGHLGRLFGIADASPSRRSHTRFR